MEERTKKWGVYIVHIYEVSVVDNTVSVTVGRLRKKIEPDARQPDYIKNVFGLGYRIGD